MVIQGDTRSLDNGTCDDVGSSPKVGSFFGTHGV